MKTLWKCVLPILISTLAVGCTSAPKKPATTMAEETEKKKMDEILEQVNRNSAKISETEETLYSISERLSTLEGKINTTLTDDNATIQEIKENLAFMNDQILRLDNSITTKRPAPRASAPSVFKPGGFDVNAAYKGALDEYYAKKYESAISGFTEILTVAPTNSLADNAQYWIGESYYGMRNYEKALEAFYKVFDYQKSNKLSDAHYKIGITYLKMGNKESAKEELQAVVKNYPNSSAAKIAAKELSSLGE